MLGNWCCNDKLLEFFSSFVLLCSGESGHERSYNENYTPSRPLWEVKSPLAWSVVRWVTTCEARVLFVLRFVCIVLLCLIKTRKETLYLFSFLFFVFFNSDPLQICRCSHNITGLGVERYVMLWQRRKQVDISQQEVAQLQLIEHHQLFSSIERVVIPSRYHQSCRTISVHNWIFSVSLCQEYSPILIRSPSEDDYRYRMVCVSGSSGPSLDFFDIETGKGLHKIPDAHQSAIFCVQISQPLPQARTLPVVISGSQDGLLKVWDLQSGNEIHSIGTEIHGGPVKAIFVYEGLNPQLYSATDKTIFVWLLESGELIRSIEATHPILSLHVHRSHEAFRDDLNPAVLVAGTSHGTILSWHLESSDPSFQYLGHHGPVHALTSATTPHLKILISCGFDSFVKLWNLVTGQLLYSIQDPLHLCPVFSLSVLLTPQVGLVIGYGDGTISVVDISNGMKLFELLGHTEAVRSVSCTLQPRPFIASCSTDATIRVWDLVTAAREEQVAAETSFIHEGLYYGLRWESNATETRGKEAAGDTDTESEEER
jgi:WD40 repeat protein